MNRLDEVIESLLEEILTEVNSISVGGALLQSPDAVQNFNAGFGGDEGDEGNLSSDITDENYDQFGERDGAKAKLVRFMWNGDKANNPAPKVKFIAT